MKPIIPATIFVNEHNTPTSQEFGDVYFSVANGAKETDYVFVEGNQLIQKWRAHTCASFSIAETGFGTGLNFFRTIQHFYQFRRDHPHHVLKQLFYISTEKHPLNKEDAAAVIKLWQQEHFLSLGDSGLSDIEVVLGAWLDAYPVAIEGIHRRHFTRNNAEIFARICLDLHYGDAQESFAQMQHPASGLIDAWFLDGFAPSKNNSLWTIKLFEQIARLSKVNTSFATFTAAGEVKRGLQNVGFNVNKQKGFGRKREMLVGHFAPEHQTPTITTYPPTYKSHAPYFVRPSLSPDITEITVVGNGLAGAIMALKLTQQGYNVRLIWQGELPSDGASGSPIGGFYPQLNAQQNAASTIQLHSFLYAYEFYRDLHLHSEFSHSWCGALQIAFNSNTEARLDKLQEANFWPLDVAYQVSAHEASSIAQVSIPYPCLYLPKAGWISPPSAVAACLAIAKASGKLSLQNQTQLLTYQCLPNNKIILNLKKNGQTPLTLYTSALVLATGSGSEVLAKDVIELRLTRGQVELVSSTRPSGKQYDFSQLKTLLCHKGYFTPAVDGFHALGSTYVKNDRNCDIREQETDANFAMHAQSMQHAAWREELVEAQYNPRNNARAAVRCSSPDHLPVVGAMPSALQFTELADLYKALPLDRYPVPSHQRNVFILSGLGSRGLTTAPLLAEVLVSQMLGHALPMHKSLLDALNPNRFIVRSLIRREPR